MEKNKRDILILIVLMTFLINYVIYFYIISPKLNNLKNSKSKHEELQEKINTASNLKIQEKTLKEEVEKLTNDTGKISQLMPSKIDTPQLIYDFYNYCKKHNVIGQSIEFQLKENNQELQTKEIDSITNETNQDNQSNQQITEKRSSTLKVLDIALDVYCSKDKLDEFLNDLNNITTRRLNIKLITISQPTQINTEDNLIDEHKQMVQGKLPVKIIFKQYIYLDENDYKNNYDYFNIKVGFDTIGDLFKD